MDNEVRITQSILDRLLDFEPRELQESPKSRMTSLSELRQAVKRDLEWLLNTRCILDPEEIGLEEVRKSVAFYGMPDITGVSVQSPAEQTRLIKAMEAALRHFEPRFLDPKVSLEPVDNLDRQLRFRIEARLDVDPVPEPIAFDSVLQFGSGFTVTET
jgi:type VI secretion system protein ImpF